MKKQPQRWFIDTGDTDHRNGTDGCWRFDADGKNGRYWLDGKDHTPSFPTLAECITDPDFTEISPVTFEPIKKRKAKPKPAKRARKTVGQRIAENSYTPKWARKILSMAIDRAVKSAREQEPRP